MKIIHDLKTFILQNKGALYLLYSIILLTLLKIGILIGFSVIPHSIEDWQIASNMIVGNGYSLHSFPTALKTPIYPFFLMPFVTMGLELGKISASVAQHIVFGLSSLLLMRAASYRFSAPFGIIIGWLFLLHPAYAYYPTVLESTALTVPLCIAYWYGIELSIYNQQLGLITMLIGWIAGLCQPILLPLILFTQFAFINKIPGKKAIIYSICSFLLVFGPWTARNTLIFDAFIPLKSPFWMNVYEGFFPSDDRNPTFISATTDKSVQYKRTILDDFSMENIYKPIVLHTIQIYPTEYFSMCVRRIRAFWTVPQRYQQDMFSIKILVSRIIPQFVLGIGMLIGVVILLRSPKLLTKSQKTVCFAALLTLLYCTVVYGLTQSSNVRFKLDIEWLQFLLLYPIFKKYAS